MTERATEHDDHTGHDEFSHVHEGLVHSHWHHHVTHNFRAVSGTFEHLSSQHEHEHDHAPLTHIHLPHQDFDKEHLGEAHVHDHSQPVEASNGKAERPAKRAAAPRKAAAKKAAAAEA